MDYNELNTWIYRQLAADASAWLSFEELDKRLAQEVPLKEWTESLRKSYLRGEIGRMIRNGQIKRKPNTAEYQLGDDVSLF